MSIIHNIFPGLRGARRSVSRFYPTRSGPLWRGEGEGGGERKRGERWNEERGRGGKEMGRGEKEMRESDGRRGEGEQRKRER